MSRAGWGGGVVGGPGRCRRCRRRLRRVAGVAAVAPLPLYIQIAVVQRGCWVTAWQLWERSSPRASTDGLPEQTGRRAWLLTPASRERDHFLFF